MSDFARFVLYDLEPEEQRDLPLFEGRKIAPHHFTLAEFPRHVRHFAFMLEQTRVRLDPEDPANEKAYTRMCELHDALKAGGFTGHELERLLVRILFCLFAEDTGIFPPDAFTQFIRTRTREDGSDLAQQLNYLFYLLDTGVPERPPGLEDEVAAFPYVNGLLFHERLGYPPFNRAMRDSLLFCCDFQWARISPAVFGSLFQGVMEGRARRQQGGHYTSERDIMKSIRSLFLDALRAEFEQLKRDRSTRRRANMEAFHRKLRSLKFLDPACGCGNFLVLTYRELRLLEIEVIREIYGADHRELNVRDLCKVDVDQFHGIELSEFPVRIAEVALWLMDHQMNQQAAEAFGQSFDRLPLRTSPHIVHGNALRMDWNDVHPRGQCSYVLGNPPFIGKAFRNAEQQADMALIWDGVKGAGVLDYVTCWYRKAAEYITGTDAKHPGSTGVPPSRTSAGVDASENVRVTCAAGAVGSSSRRDAETNRRDACATRICVAFVSTNSISQGEQVGILWGELFQRFHLKIHFAHRTFAWASESRGKAHVHVVIIGFGALDVTGKRIFDYEADASAPTEIPAGNISPYLVEGSDVVINKRSRPLCDVAELSFGNMPNDGGHLLLSEPERQELVAVESAAASLIRPFLGPDEFLYNVPRWCLWLADASPAAIRACPLVMQRIESVREHRKKSARETTKNLAATPSLFGEIRQPLSRYLAIPKTSSERRTYIPMAFLEPEVIAGTDLFTAPDATPFHFGILSSTMHSAWVRLVAGRLESRYRYSAGLVYNNFPWPNSTPEQRARVEERARAVLAARESHLPPRGMSTLADLYDPLTMPAALAKAHADLDRAVEKCYRSEPFHSDRERVEHLFRLYEQLTAPLLPATTKTRQRRSQTATPTAAPRRSRTPGLPATPVE